MHGTRQRQEAIDPFVVVLQVEATQTSVVLCSASDPNRAMVVFPDAFQRLAQDQVIGDLLLVHHDEEPRTLLRQPLGKEPSISWRRLGDDLLKYEAAVISPR